MTDLRNRNAVAFLLLKRCRHQGKFRDSRGKELGIAWDAYYGQAGPAINLHAHQHNVAVTTDAVAALFQPLDC